MLVHRINVLQKASKIICPPVRNCWNCGPLQRQIEDVKGKGCLTKGISEKQQWGRLAAYLNSVTTVQSASGTLQAVTMPQIGPPLTRISLLTETETASGADTSVINMESFEAQGMNQSHLESGEFVLHNPDGTRTSCIPIDPITIVKPFARCHDGKGRCYVKCPDWRCVYTWKNYSHSQYILHVSFPWQEDPKKKAKAMVTQFIIKLAGDEPTYWSQPLEAMGKLKGGIKIIAELTKLTYASLLIVLLL